MEKPEVWMHKETGQLWLNFKTVLFGMAIRSVAPQDEGGPTFTNWSDWQKKGYFHFDDEPEYNPDNFENLGEL